MYSLGNSDMPAIFNDIVKNPEHKYPIFDPKLHLKKVFFD